MNWREARNFIGISACALALVVPTANADQRSKDLVSMSIAHGISSIPSAKRVDVYANKTLIARDLNAGEMETRSIKPGSYQIVVVPNGQSRETSNPLIRIPKLTLKSGENRTLALHTTAANRPASTVFTNRTRTVGQNMGLMTFRNIAQAPTVGIRSRGELLMKPIANGATESTGLESGNYNIRIVRLGTREKLIPNSVQTILNKPGRNDMGNNRIVYLWGSEKDGTLDLMVQDIPLGLD